MARLIDRDVAIKEIERCAATTQDARETRQCCVAAIACFVPTVDAIPVGWLIDRANDPERAPLYRRYAQMLYEEWQKKQEAQDGRV